MRIGNFVFRPTLWPTLAFIVMLPTLLGLGIWQLHRAEEKRELFAHFATGGGSAPQPLEDVLAADHAPRYVHVEAHGRYDSEHQILLDSMTGPEGVAGYQVLTPFHTDNGRWLLVDRGWVPRMATRDRLPDVEVPAQPRRVSGLLDRLPRPGMRLGGAAEPTSRDWPRVLLYPRADDIAQALGHPVLDHRLLLDADAPNGYVRDWHPAQFGPARHQAYAVQWFAFAAVLIGIWIGVNTRRIEPPEA